MAFKKPTATTPARKATRKRPKPKAAPKRVGTAKPTRKSQITGKAPSKRLVKRRKSNTTPGYFPNPAEVAKAHAPICYYVATVKSYKTVEAARKAGLELMVKHGIPLRIISD